MAFLRTCRRDVRRFSAVFFVRFLLAPDQAQRGGRDVFGGEAEVFHDLGARSGRAVMIDTDHDALVAGPAVPAVRGAGLYRDALLQRLWQNALAIGFVLLLE